MASSPAAPNGGVAGFMKKYRTFVRRHRALLSAIEQGAAGMTWFIEGENSEVWAEAASVATRAAVWFLLGPGPDNARRT